jgi:hypothetical protein
MSSTKQERISIAVSKELYEQVKALAYIKQLSVSELLCTLCQKAVADNEKTIKAYNEQVKKLSKEVNL